jgi:site-specific recombinase XerD
MELNTKNIIKLDTISKFHAFLNEKKFKLNTIGKRLSHLRTFLNVLYRRELIDYNPFTKFRITIPNEPSVSIALDEAELKRLSELDLASQPTFALVRDQFLAMCWTGLRISDFRNFVNLDFGKEAIVTTINKKTGKEAHIPILSPLRRILEKYNGSFPRMISEQKMRIYLKRIAEMVPEMHSNVEIQYTEGSKTKRMIMKRYQLVHLHTARRTLATLLYRRGFEVEKIMLVTGHRTLKSLKTYLKITKKEVLNDMVVQFERQVVQDASATVSATASSE